MSAYDRKRTLGTIPVTRAPAHLLGFETHRRPKPRGARPRAPTRFHKSCFRLQQRCGHFPVWAEQPKKPVIGLLGSTSADAYASRIASIRQGLSEIGFVEGKNVMIEYRLAIALRENS